MPQRSTSRRTRRDELVERIANLGPWSHNIDLHGVMTAPHHHLGADPGFAWDRFSRALPEDLGGKAVLDIGCNAGFHAIEMKRRGAARVVGIDSDPRHLQQAGLAAEVLDVDIELRRLSVYEVAELDERFDLVLLTGALSRLRHPLHALALVHEHVAGDMMVVQSASGSDCPAGEPSEPTHVEALLRSAGFAIEARLEEVYICRATWSPEHEP